jgi:hypothetical protein
VSCLAGLCFQDLARYDYDLQYCRTPIVPSYQLDAWPRCELRRIKIGSPSYQQRLRLVDLCGLESSDLSAFPKQSQRRAILDSSLQEGWSRSVPVCLLEDHAAAETWSRCSLVLTYCLVSLLTADSSARCIQVHRESLPLGERAKLVSSISRAEARSTIASSAKHEGSKGFPGIVRFPKLG